MKTTPDIGKRIMEDEETTITESNDLKIILYLVIVEKWEKKRAECNTRSTSYHDDWNFQHCPSTNYLHTSVTTTKFHNNIINEDGCWNCNIILTQTESDDPVLVWFRETMKFSSILTDFVVCDLCLHYNILSSIFCEFRIYSVRFFSARLPSLTIKKSRTLVVHGRIFRKCRDHHFNLENITSHLRNDIFNSIHDISDLSNTIVNHISNLTSSLRRSLEVTFVGGQF